MTLIKRLSKKWQIKGSLNLIDIGFSYYVARFTNVEDYEYVLTGGPWLIDDHYLTIRKWVPNFIPNDESIKILNAWIRIPDLAVEYFDSKFQHKAGAKIGKVIKIDQTTAKAERGKFTRMCFEIDLSKPLLSKFQFKGKIWKIQYEGLSLICYNCGRINYKKEDYLENRANQVIQSDSNGNKLKLLLKFQMLRKKASMEIGCQLRNHPEIELKTGKVRQRSPCNHMQRFKTLTPRALTLHPTQSPTHPTLTQMD